jgi:hypothetical protein
LLDISPLRTDSKREWDAVVEDEQGDGKQEEGQPNRSIQTWVRREKRPDDHVDAHMLVAPQGVRRSQHEDGGKQVPLDFKPCIRTHIQRVADDGVAGADDDGQPRARPRKRQWLSCR